MKCTMCRICSHADIKFACRVIRKLVGRKGRHATLTSKVQSHMRHATCCLGGREQESIPLNLSGCKRRKDGIHEDL